MQGDEAITDFAAVPRRVSLQLVLESHRQVWPRLPAAFN